jgi:RNA polymerase sigma-70 factor (ECF subfamily)
VNDAQATIQASSASAVRWLADHGDALYRYALVRARDTHVAEDLVQETLLAALGSSSNFAGRSAERTWLIGILKHKIVDHLRAAIRHQPLTELQSQAGPDIFDKNGNWKVRVSKWECDPHTMVENVEFQSVLASCLSKLPPRIALVFWLRELESMTSDEVCEELEITPTNAWTMLHRARLGLQRCLSVNWFESGGK